jgi:O-antigen ligase
MNDRSVRARLAVPLMSTSRLLLLAVGVALVSNLTLRAIGPMSAFLAVGAVAVCAAVAWRLDELLALFALVGCVVIDWYQLVNVSILRYPIVAPTLATLLIGVLLLSQRQDRTWVRVPHLWLWAALLVLAVPAFARVPAEFSVGSLTFYGLQVLLTPFLLYILGIQLGRDIPTVRRMLAMISGFGAVVAAHTILIAQTGIFLFETSHQASLLVARGNFAFGESGTVRVGSFLLNPDWNGTFLMMMACITAGLYIEGSSRAAKLTYGIELALILSALLFTYSLAALVAAGVGLIVLILMVRRWRPLIGFIAVLGAAIALVVTVFPAELSSLQEHASDPSGGALRVGVWLTALRVIAAYPITGLGLSQFVYLQGAEPFRVPMETVQESHPHESYLELAAMGGLPLLIMFLVLLGTVMWGALRVYRSMEPEHRPLLAGAFAAIVGLVVNSLAINGWTLPPPAALAWFVLGLISSPSLTRLVPVGATGSSRPSRPSRPSRRVHAGSAAAS